MKFTKRITSMLLIFVFAFTSMYMVAPAADFSDVAGDYAHYEAITALVDQGIINGYEDGTFKPENTITRAEFSKLLAVSSAPSGYTFSATTTAFPDIADMNAAHGWAVPYISYAVSTKAINGYTDGTFQPGNNVTYGEAIKMIVCTLGYAPVADTTLTPWYQGYLNIANQIGLTKNAAALGDAPANRGIVAHLIYNMLDCPVLSQTGVDALGNPIYSTGSGEGSSFGEQKDNAKSAEGVVMGVTDYSLDATAVGRNRIQIDNEVYTLGGNLSMDTVKSYIGYRVSYSYTGTGGKQEVTKITRLNGYNSSVTLEPWQIDNITTSYIEYYADEKAEYDNKTTKVTFGAKPYVIYNGVPVKPADVGAGFDVTNYFNVETGTVTLFSNDSNEKSAELVIVESYETYFVNSTPPLNNGVITLYDKNQALTEIPSLEIDEDDVVSVTKVSSKGGSQTASSLSAIDNKSVVSVAKPYGTTEGTKVIISSAYVTGEVSGTDDAKNAITIGTAEYVYSPYYELLEQMDPEQFNLNLRDNVKIYLDYLGRIVFTEKNESSDPYGLVVAYKEGSGVNSTKSVMLLGADGKSPEPYVLDAQVRVKVGTTTYDSDDDAINALKSAATISAGTSIAVPVRYVNRGDVIKSIEILTAEKAKGSYKYSKSGNSFTASGATFNVAGSGANKTTIFAVPLPQNYNSYNEYKKATIGTLFSDKGDYEVAAYDLSGTTARLLVCYLKANQSASAEIVSATPVYMVEDVRDTTNNNQTVRRITYRQINADYNSESASDFTSDETSVMTKADSLKNGDLIKFVKENNEITDIKTVFIGGDTLTSETGKVVASDGVTNYHISRDGNYTNDKYYQVIYGTVNTIDTEAGNMSILYNPEANSALDNGVTGDSFTLSGSVKYYKYDTGRNGVGAKFVQASPASIIAFNGKPQDAVATKVVAVYMNGSVIGIYVLDK